MQPSEDFPTRVRSRLLAIFICVSIAVSGCTESQSKSHHGSGGGSSSSSSSFHSSSSSSIHSSSSSSSSHSSSSSGSSLNGGEPGFTSGLDPSKMFSDLTADEKESYCAALIDFAGSSGFSENLCTLIGIFSTSTFGLTEDECQSLTDSCTADSTTTCTLTTTDVSTCTATVEEADSCVSAEAALVDDVVTEVSCTDAADPETSGDVNAIRDQTNSVPECEIVKAKCPQFGTNIGQGAIPQIFLK